MYTYYQPLHTSETARTCHSHNLWEQTQIIMSPLCTQRWGHIALHLSTQSLSVCAVSLPFISVQRFLWCRRSNTRRWPDVGLMLAHRLWRWPNISPVLVYRVMFGGATQNVGQRHRWWANINPALVQSIVPVLPACRYWQHEVLNVGLNGYWPASATLPKI